MPGRVRQVLYWIVAGGAFFWLPVLIVAAILRDNAGLLALNAGPILGLVVLVLARRLRHRPAPRWGWVLAGIYILGPVALLVASSADHGWSTASLKVPWFIALLCLFPPTTLWFATLSGTLFAVLAPTVAVPVFFAYREIQEGRAQARRNTSKAA